MYNTYEDFKGGTDMTVTEYTGRELILPANTELALGFFDGVHIGHRDIIKGVVKSAKETGRIPAVFSFHSLSEGLKTGAKRIYSDHSKTEIFESLGIELVVLADFDSVKGLSPEEFVTRVLLCDLKCKVAHFGFDFRFGKNAAGDAEMLSRLMREGGAETAVYEERQRNGVKLSSTAVREALSEGRVKDAAEMLGEAYFVCGKVEKGLGKGRTWGIPTVNIPLPRDCALKGGVYLTGVVADNFTGYAITNVGSCPTVEERDTHLEGFILDFNRDLYGKKIKMSFLYFLREERLFKDTDELATQIRSDEKRAREIIRAMENEK